MAIFIAMFKHLACEMAICAERHRASSARTLMRPKGRFTLEAPIAAGA
jgi:hypothetical protein